MQRFFTALFLLIILKVSAQTPSAPKFINYQGVARDGANVPITTAFDIQFVIKDLTQIVHSEIQTGIQPSSLGLFSTKIGISPTFTYTGWGSNNLQLEVSIRSGATFTQVGIQQIVSVPFSFFANDVPSSYTNSVLTIGNNSYNIVGGSAATPTINGTGLVTVTPNTGPVYTVDVPTPALTFSGSTLIYSQGSFVTSTPINPNLSGDVNGTLSTTTVTALRNFPISSISPTNGQVLALMSGSWTPTTPSVAAAGPWQKVSNNVSLIVPSDNVGIGIGNPGAKLEVAGSPTTNMSIIKTTNSNPASTFPAIEISSNGTSALLASDLSASSGIAGNFNSNAGTAVYGSSGGPIHSIVGINTNASNTAYAGLFDGGLLTKGKTNSSAGNAFIVQNLATTTLMMVRNDGNVGIGTLSPNTKLDVLEPSGSAPAITGKNTSAAANSAAVGILGETNNTDVNAAGVFGNNTNNGSGVYGKTNSTNSNAAGVLGENTSAGPSVRGVKNATVTNGGAGKFEIQSAANTNDALFAITQGTGAAVHAATGTATTSALSLLLDNGHIKAVQSSSAVIGKGASVGNATIGGSGPTTDVAGEISFNTQSPISGTSPFEVAKVTFARAYDNIPSVIVTPRNGTAATNAFFVSPTTSGFSIYFPNTPPTFSNFQFTYIVIGH